MYDVPSGFLETYDEWIEIYNRGADTVSLSGWQFGYWSGGWVKRKLSALAGDLLIGPGEYAALHEYAERWYSQGYGDTPPTLIDLLGAIDLNATSGNTIALFNYKGEIVEQFIFPILASDRTIERKNPYLENYTSTNWEAANLTGGETHTGGRANTVALPQIAIVNPSNNFDTYIKNITISGTTLNSWAGDTIIIYRDTQIISSFNISTINANWQTSIELSGRSDTIIAVLYDCLGRIAADTKIINYYEELNLFADLIFIEYDSMIKPLYIDIQTFGTAPGDTLYIFNQIVNDTEIVVLNAINDTYYDTIVLSDYGDTIWITLIDRFGRCDSDYVTVYYYPEIKIKIQSPQNYSDTFVNTIILSGTTLGIDRGCTVVVYNANGIINDTVISRHLDDDWACSVAVGVNAASGIYRDTIVVQLFDRFTRIAFDTIFINYFPEQIVRITSPLNNYDTNIQVITLSGTTFGSRVGDTISLYVNCYKESEFIINADNSNWSGTVALSDQCDSVVAQLTDRFGRSVYDTIAINYFGAASIAIEEPWYDYDTFGHIINVGGITYNSRAGDSIAIYLNNIFQDSFVLTDNNGEWRDLTAYISGISDSLVAILYSQWGGVACDTIPVNFFDTISVIITSPLNNSETIAQNIIVEGVTFGVNGPDKVEIFMNNDLLNRKDVYYIYEKNETWSVNAALTGNDTLIVKLTDQFGRIAWDTISVRYIPPPDIDITAPPNNSDTIINIINISGTTQNTFAGDSIEIYVNGNLTGIKSLTSDNGNFSDTALLTNFSNLITAKVIDKYGRTNYDTIVINYYDTPFIYFTIPSQNYRYDTTASSIIIGGTVTPILTNDSVYIYLNGDTYSSTSLSSNFWSDTFNIINDVDTLVVKITDIYNRSGYDTIIIGSGYKLSGYVGLENGAFDSANITVVLYNDTEYFMTLTNETGYFILKFLSFDSYFIAFDKGLYKKKIISVFADNANKILEQTIYLQAGDYFKDNNINIKDAAILKKYFNQSSSYLDLNSDNTINETEKYYLFKNFEK